MKTDSINRQSLWLGTLIYWTIRFVNDSVAGCFFWERPWYEIAIEWSMAILVAYIILRIASRYIAEFDAQKDLDNPKQQIIYEVKKIFWASFLVLNILAPFPTIFLDDGMQWEDPVMYNFVGLGMAMMYFIYLRANHYIQAFADQKTKGEQLARQQIETELKFLRAQVNPHFLFNALNSIYFLMDDDLKSAKNALEKFSEMLRYQLYDCNEGEVALNKELEYLNNYVELQRIRKSEKLKIDLSIPTCSNERQIAPFLLIPLVENAFKYVGNAKWIRLQIQCTPQSFQLQIENAIPEPPIKSEGGIGLENLRRRLQLLYPNRHELLTESKDQSFLAQLQIQFYEN